jgi:peptidase M28-like protein
MPGLPRAARRRRQVADLERPVNARLYRITLAVALLVVLAVSFTVTRPDALPQPPPPAFDRASAVSLAVELSTAIPDRRPGTPGAERAADWVSRHLASYGYRVARDRFSARIPGRGEVALQNLTAAARGRTGRAIVIVAHRDDAGSGPGANVNASGTAALLELARLYGSAARTAGGGALTPTHTLIFVSTDGGAFGSLGADRYTTRPGVKQRALAAVNLAAIAGRARVRLDIAGVSARSPSAALMATATARVRELTGRSPRHTGVVGQLVDLAFPLSLYDHAPFLAREIPALTLTTANVRPPAPFGDGPERLSTLRLGQIGASAQALVDSIDQGLELEPSPSSYILLGSRIVAGWAVEVALVALVLPVPIALAELLSRRRRLGFELGAAARAQWRRLSFWLFAVVVFWAFAAAGLWVEGEPRPLSPFSAVAGNWPVLAVGAYLAILAAGWLVARLRLRGAPADPAEEVGAYVAALATAAAAAAATTGTNPYALVFVLPSLHAWLWLLQARGARAWLRVGLFAAGFTGPLVLLGSLAVRFGLGFDAPWYLAALAAVGYVPPAAVLIAALWLAAAGQVGALAFGRYAPYPGRAARRRHGMVALVRRLHTPGA